MSTESSVVVLLQDTFHHGVERVVSLHWAVKFLLVVVLALAALYRYMTYKHGYFKKIGLEGPKPGLLGILADYRKIGFRDLDEQLIKKYGKVIPVFHGRSPSYVIADPDIVKEIMVKHFSNFVNRMGPNLLPKDILFNDALNAVQDDHWKFLRTTLSPTFTAGRMREMVPLIQHCCETLVTVMDKEGEGGQKDLEMKSIFSRFTMASIASTAFGLDVDTQTDPDNPFNRYAHTLLTDRKRLIFAIMLCSFFPFMAKVLTTIGFRLFPKGARDFFMSAAISAIEERKSDTQHPRRDFLELMLTSHKLEEDKTDEDPDTHLQDVGRIKKRGLTDNEIISNAVVFLLAGFDTTQITLTFMAYLLTANQECQEKLYEEIETVLQGKAPDYDSIFKMQYLDNVFNETLRIYPPALRTTRHADETIEIKGVTIEKGMDIHISITGLHRNPDYWPDPDNFDPDRFLPENIPENLPYVYLPFGVGPRNCVGKRLAQLEVKMAIVSILQNFKLVNSPNTEIPVVGSSDGLARPKNPVYIRAVRRK